MTQQQQPSATVHCDSGIAFTPKTLSKAAVSFFICSQLFLSNSMGAASPWCWSHVCLSCLFRALCMVIRVQWTCNAWHAFVRVLHIRQCFVWCVAVLAVCLCLILDCMFCVLCCVAPSLVSLFMFAACVILIWRFPLHLCGWYDLVSLLTLGRVLRVPFVSHVDPGLGVHAGIS